MQLTIISDCRDDNARARQILRYQALLGNVNTTFIGVGTDLEASGNLIDAIDAHKDSKGIIVVNVAPRGNKEQYPNGIPFCFHWFKNLLIIGTPNCFSLAKKLGMFKSTFETDVLNVCSKFLPEEEAIRISESQFRSYEYLPYLAKWLVDGEDIPSNKIQIQNFGYQNFVWSVDCFGNCKTTSTNKWVNIIGRTLLDPKRYERLTDVIDGDPSPALVRGSSGYRNKRFLEIMLKGRPASEIFHYKVGDQV